MENNMATVLDPPQVAVYPQGSGTVTVTLSRQEQGPGYTYKEYTVRMTPSSDEWWPTYMQYLVKSQSGSESRAYGELLHDATGYYFTAYVYLPTATGAPLYGMTNITAIFGNGMPMSFNDEQASAGTPKGTIMTGFGNGTVLKLG